MVIVRDEPVVRTECRRRARPPGAALMRAESWCASTRRAMPSGSRSVERRLGYRAFSLVGVELPRPVAAGWLAVVGRQQIHGEVVMASPGSLASSPAAPAH